MSFTNYKIDRSELEFILKKINFNIKKLGKPAYHTPIRNINYIKDNERILFDINYNHIMGHYKKNSMKEMITLEKAGPRERLYFNPEKTTAGIVTCGGLCPGLNDVIRALVMQLYYQYNVKKILGFQYGYQGIFKDSKIKPLILTPKDVEPIHNLGGTLLGSSRGSSGPVEIVDGLKSHGIDILFTIGGDGTIRGSIDTENEISKQGLNISLVNIPKTIDNDIPFISRSFGFQTAFSEAVKSIRCAHNEARSAPNGIGMVKVMGRQSGFIAAQTALAQKDVNYVLIPEIEFDLEGPDGLLNELEKRLKRAKHALIVVAEGTGQDILNKDCSLAHDASGNVKLKDIGIYLKGRINDHFKKKKIEVNIKYIDPSYIIRSIPATPEDSLYCGFLGEHAVHAAMSGRTRMIIGMWNETFINLPMDIVKLGRNKIEPKDSLWQSVLLSTGQPSLKNNKSSNQYT